MRDDAVHDICLVALGYVPYWLHYDIIGVAERAGTPEVFTGFYDNLKAIPTPHGTWADYLPAGNPADNWDEWEEAALRFLSDPQGYVAGLPTVDGDWQAAMDHAATLLPDYHRAVAVPLDLCPIYDQVWPKVLGNCRTMTVDATVDAETVALVKRGKSAMGAERPLPFSIVRKRMEAGDIDICPSCMQPTTLYQQHRPGAADLFAIYPMKEN